MKVCSGSTPAGSWRPNERPLSLRVFGRLPDAGVDAGRGGRRPKSLEGGNRGEFRVGGSVGLWGFRRSVWLDFSVADRNDDRASGATLGLVGLDAVEALISY
jgi:hypothetical protein